MRSKLVVWGYLVVLSLGTMLSLYMPKTEAAAKESIVIPGEAIRLRILANSDFEKDQAIKRKVRDAVNAQITLWVQDLTSMEEAKKVMTTKLPEIQTIAEKVVQEQGSDQSVKVEFGKVQFPTKLYGQFLYPAGEYQAILITLGKGEGANWWCVLYPPLCFLDFSNGVAVSEGFEDQKVAKAEMISSKEVDTRPKVDVVQEPAKEVDTQPKIEVKPEPAKEVETKSKVEVKPEPAKKVETKSKVEVKPEPAKKVVAQPKVEVKPEPVKKEAAVSEVEEVKVEAERSPVVEEANPVKKEEKEVKEPKKQQEEVKKPKKQAKKEAPVYTAEDEEPVKVKFFVVEMWEKVFN